MVGGIGHKVPKTEEAPAKKRAQGFIANRDVLNREVACDCADDWMHGARLYGEDLGSRKHIKITISRVGFDRSCVKSVKATQLRSTMSAEKCTSAGKYN
jgi:hypothetical protein